MLQRHLKSLWVSQDFCNADYYNKQVGEQSDAPDNQDNTQRIVIGLMLKVDLDYYGKTYGFDIKNEDKWNSLKTDWERRKFLVDKLVDAGEIERPDSSLGYGTEANYNEDFIKLLTFLVALLV